MSSTSTIIVQTLSVTTSLLAAGGIATLSLFDIPELQAQPASRSLPSIRWLFSRGSHIFPSAAVLSGSGFAYLAYFSLPTSSSTLIQLLKIAVNGRQVNGYLAAAALAISIGPFTTYAMVPTNFALIKMNEEKGGARSEASARELSRSAKPGERSAEDSVNGKGEGSQFTDLSGPQSKTSIGSSDEDDRRARDLLGQFSVLNMARAVLLGAGGLVGLVTALAAI